MCICCCLAHVQTIFSLLPSVFQHVMGDISDCICHEFLIWCRFWNFCWYAVVTVLLQIDSLVTFLVPNCKHTCSSGLGAIVIKVMKWGWNVNGLGSQSSTNTLVSSSGRPEVWQLGILKSLFGQVVEHVTLWLTSVASLFLNELLLPCCNSQHLCAGTISLATKVFDRVEVHLIQEIREIHG